MTIIDVRAIKLDAHETVRVEHVGEAPAIVNAWLERCFFGLGQIPILADDIEFSARHDEATHCSALTYRLRSAPHAITVLVPLIGVLPCVGESRPH